MKRYEGHDHIGHCTQGDLYTREHAVEVLLKMGFLFDPTDGEWVDSDDRRGRLCWSPDFCKPGEEVHGEGTRFWLRRPDYQAEHGEIEVIADDWEIAHAQSCARSPRHSIYACPDEPLEIVAAP